MRAGDLQADLQKLKPWYAASFVIGERFSRLQQELEQVQRELLSSEGEVD